MSDVLIDSALHHLNLLGILMNSESTDKENNNTQFEKYVYLNLEKLFTYGYILVYDDLKNIPIFCPIKVLNSKSNLIPYELNVIPYDSLSSFSTWTIKNDWNYN